MIVFLAVLSAVMVAGGVRSILSTGDGREGESTGQVPPDLAERPRARDDAGTAYVNLLKSEGGGAGGSGNLAGAYYRDGRFFLATVGHVANVLGARMFDYQGHKPVGSVAYSTGDASGSDQGDGAALVDVGTGRLPPLLRIATTTAHVPGASVALPPVAAVSSVFTEGAVPAGEVACHSSFFPDSPTYTQGNGYRCGKLTTTCTASAPECWLGGSPPFVASGDSGGPVWKPRPDGTIELIGFVRHQAANQSLIGFTPTSAYPRHEWTVGAAPGYPGSPGGSFVTVPGPPNDLRASLSEHGGVEATWRASAAHPADPVKEYRVILDGRLMAVTDPATVSSRFATNLMAGTHVLVVQAVDHWGVVRSSTTTFVT